MTVYVESLGCPKNLVDSELILKRLANKYKITYEITKADIIIINTCGFIKSAKQEAIEYILVYSQLENKRIIVIGCLVNLYKDELQRSLPEIKEFYTIEEFFLKFLNLHYNKHLDYSQYLNLTPKSYSYVKISDGCDRQCSYCTIPLIKGKQFSRPIDNIIKEIKVKLDFGFKEIILIAQDLIRFGNDNRENLIKLIENIEKVNNHFRLRLLYLYPDPKIIDLIKVMNQSEKIVHYIDLPLQHISSKILKLMNRPYDEYFYYKLLDSIKSLNEDFIIRSTFIIGFPGEDEKDFQNLLKFLEKYQLNWAGFYGYSDEEKAKSSVFLNKINNQNIRKRLLQANDVQKAITAKWLHSRLNKVYHVLIDEIVDNKDEKYILTRSECEAPEIDGSIIVRSEKKYQVGKWLNIKINNTLDYDLEGEIYV